MKKVEVLSLFLLFVALSGLFAFTVYREIIMGDAVMLTISRTGGEGEEQAQTEGQTQGTTNEETITGFREPPELHYDIFGAYVGTVLICLVTVFFWMRRFLKMVRETANDSIGEFVRSGLLFIGGMFFAIIGLFLVAVIILLL